MKTLFPALLFFLFLPFPLAAEAEKEAVDLESLKHPRQPALFRVAGPDLKEPSYLFGTIHLADPRVTTLHPEAEKAFKRADRFYAEIDLAPEKQMAAAALFLRKDGKTLTGSIGPELSQKLNEALSDINPALTTAPLNPLKTWVMAAQLPMLKLQIEGKEALDQALYRRAKESGKKVSGLETLESQLKIFDDLEEKAQIALLRSTLEFMAKERKEGEDSMQEMVEAYLTGNVPEIGKLVTRMTTETNELDEEMKEVSADLIQKLLPDRNRSMTETIAATLKEFPEESHFFAVGAGHYSGETAIQKLLAQKGYTVTPLFE